MELKVWIKDRLFDAQDAKVPYDDHGVTVGDGVFETMKIAQSEIFALTRHLDRLEASASKMLLPPLDIDLIRSGIQALLDDDPSDGFMRVTITAGIGPLGSGRQDSEPFAVIARRPGAVRVDPTQALLVRWTRNERGALAGVKSTSYGENVVALSAADSAGCSEALFPNGANELCEGTGSNVFVGFDDRLITPPLSSGCLAGVTRALLLEAGVGTEEDISIEMLAGATEMLLVSTTREVQPVSKLLVQDASLGLSDITFDLAPGPLTAQATEVWNDQIRSQIDP